MDHLTTRFTRALTIEANRVIVEDAVTLSAEKPVQWYFQSDAPIDREGDSYVLGGKPGARLNLDAHEVSSSIAPTLLMAPGQPGSITKGTEERRGFHVKVESKPVTAIRLKALVTF